MVSWVSRPLNIKLSFKKWYCSSENIIFYSSSLPCRSKLVHNHTNSSIFTRQWQVFGNLYNSDTFFTIVTVTDVKFIVWERQFQSSITMQVVSCDNHIIHKMSLSLFPALNFFCCFFYSVCHLLHLVINLNRNFYEISKLLFCSGTKKKWDLVFHLFMELQIKKYCLPSCVFCCIWHWQLHFT